MSRSPQEPEASRGDWGLQPPRICLSPAAPQSRPSGTLVVLKPQVCAMEGTVLNEG